MNKRIYFIGIGGIGMSALARYMLNKGYEVYGYDKTQTELTKKLESEGMHIIYVDDVNSIPSNIEFVVYTPAIPRDHKQLNCFLNSGIKVMKRAAFLGALTSDKYTVAVAGTHGKTTTSGIAAHLLHGEPIDATAFIGGILSNYGRNYLNGSSDVIVVEADEYDRSFLHLSPDIAVVTNVDADHLDIYGDHHAVLAGFEEFILRVKLGGILLIHEDAYTALDSSLWPKLLDRKVKVLQYGWKEGAELKIDHLKVEDGKFHFTIQDPKSNTFDWLSNLPGRHNVENTVAAAYIAFILGVQSDLILSRLSAFLGIKRRFERVYESDQVIYIDDYAHHPSEISSVLGACREMYRGRKLTVVFQPHLYSRTKDFHQAFGKELSRCDQVILLPIYPAREEPIPGVNSELILSEITIDNKLVVEKEHLIDHLKNCELDIIMTLGAGDIDTCVKPIKEFLNKKTTH